MTPLSRTAEGSYTHPQDPGEAAYASAVPRMSVTDEEAAHLAEMARGKRVLEIGTGLGVSTRALASTAALVVTVDNDPWVHEAIWPDLAAVPHVALCGQVPDGEEPFGLIFIDGDHRKESVARDIGIAKALCAVDGTVVFHDVKYSTVESAILAACRNMRVIDTVHGLGVVDAADL